MLRVGALRVCYDKMDIKAMETVFVTPFGKGHTPRSVFLETQKAIMVQYMQGCAWRPERDMKGWCLGGQPHLPAENHDGEPNLDNEDYLSHQSNFVCFFVTAIDDDENVSLLLCMSTAPWSSSCACDTRRHVSPQLRFSVAEVRGEVLTSAPGTGDRRTSAYSFSNQYSGMGRKDDFFDEKT